MITKIQTHDGRGIAPVVWAVLKYTETEGGRKYHGLPIELWFDCKIASKRAENMSAEGEDDYTEYPFMIDLPEEEGVSGPYDVCRHMCDLIFKERDPYQGKYEID
jgi:hypothetical protein